MRQIARSVSVLCSLVTVVLAAPSPDVLRVREWRAAHERQILAELIQLVSLPNIASNKADIVKNADAADGDVREARLRGEAHCDARLAGLDRRARAPRMRPAR